MAILAEKWSKKDILLTYLPRAMPSFNYSLLPEQYNPLITASLWAMQPVNNAPPPSRAMPPLNNSLLPWAIQPLNNSHPLSNATCQ